MSIARARTVVGSLYALMRNALGLNVATPLEEQELSCTVAPDRRLVVLGHEPISGFERDHGTVADEAAMLALHTLDSATLLVDPRFVAPGDSCTRADDPGWRWHCLRGHGTALSDWERRPLAGALAGLAASGHTHTIDQVSGLAAALAGKQDALANAAALALKAPLASPAFTGAPTAPTPTAAAGIATKGYVDQALEAADGGGFAVDPDGPPDQEREFAYAANGDTNGICYHLGTNQGRAAWTNPHTAGYVTVVRSTESQGAPYYLVDRSGGLNCHTSNESNPWVCIDLKAMALRPNFYTLRNRGQYNGYPMRDWKLQGSNNVAGNSVAQINAATWVDLDVRVSDTSQADAADAWGSYAMTAPSTAYRWVRVLATAAQYLCIAEIELYGYSVASVLLPAGAKGWATNGSIWVPYYAGG